MPEECQELIEVWKQQAEDLRRDRSSYTWKNYQVGSILRICASQLESAISDKKNKEREGEQV